MKPIEPPTLINKGIAIFCPPPQDKSKSLIVINIYYSKTHPQLSWTDCDTRSALIWTSRSTQTPEGLLFLYESILKLEAGFYTIKITSSNGTNIKQGQTTIGLLSDQDNLIIGSPYSSYPPIELS